MAKKNNLFEMGSNFNDDWDIVVDKKKNTKPKPHKLEPNKHNLHFRKEKRRGKPVTLVGELFISKDEMQKLCKELKKHLASGGSIRDNYLEFQGENSERIKSFLIKKGFRFKN